MHLTETEALQRCDDSPNQPPELTKAKTMPGYAVEFKNNDLRESVSPMSLCRAFVCKKFRHTPLGGVTVRRLRIPSF